MTSRFPSNVIKNDCLFRVSNSLDYLYLVPLMGVLIESPMDLVHLFQARRSVHSPRPANSSPNVLFWTEVWTWIQATYDIFQFKTPSKYILNLVFAQRIANASFSVWLYLSSVSVMVRLMKYPDCSPFPMSYNSRTSYDKEFSSHYFLLILHAQDFNFGCF